MLKYLLIKNFKSYRRKKFVFSRGVNVILGRPSSGKTNFISAIELLFENRPSSARVLSNFQKEGIVKVEAKTSEKKIISITRDIKEKKINDAEYKVDEQSFRRMGRDVPDLVKAALNMNALNLQEQFEEHFLIRGAGSKITKTINKVVQLENIEVMKVDLRQQIKQSKDKIKQCNVDIQEKREQKKILPDMTILKKRFVRYKSLKKKQIEFMDDIESLGDYIGEINLMKKKKEHLSAFVEVEKANKKYEILVEADGVYNKQIGDLSKFIELRREKIESKDEIQSVFNRIIKQVKEMKQCPLCFSDINKKQIEVIKKNL